MLTAVACGRRSLGVPVGGPADAFALALGNGLVGNPPDAAALEVCLSGPTLRCDDDLACVVFGAPFSIQAGRRRLTANRTFTLRAGEELAIGGTAEGMRAYLCVRGGLDGPLILGSRSALQPLAVGNCLPCQSGTIIGRGLLPRFAWNAEPRLLRCIAGAQEAWFPPGCCDGRRFTVTPASDRMGLRLHGEPLPCPNRDLVSEPVCPGTVQVTRDGQCIVLGVDGQTTWRLSQDCPDRRRRSGQTGPVATGRRPHVPARECGRGRGSLPSQAD